jgi:hypothetical protein
MRNKTVKDAIQEFIEGKAYFSVKALKTYLKNEEIVFKDRTVIQHLYNMRDTGKIFNSGYGWYSTIPDSDLDIDDSISNLAQLISDKYPYLDFSIWSTRQIFNYFHHLPARHLILIYTDPDALHSLFDFLIDKGYTVYNNPTKEILNRHWIPEEDTVILRPEISQAPVSDTRFLWFATVEKILVDLYLEKDRLMYMDGAEFNRILDNILFKNRLNISTLLRYAGRREVRKKFEKLLFQDNDFEVIKNPYRRIE